MGRCYVKLAIYLTLLPGQWRREVNGRHYKRPSDIMCLYKWGDGVVKKCDLAANSINPHDGNRLRWERPMLLRHAIRPFCWAYKCFSNTQIDVG